MNTVRATYSLFIFLPVRQAINNLKSARWDDVFKIVALLLFACGVVWAEFIFFNRFWHLLQEVPFGIVIMLPNAFSYMGSFLFAFLVYSSILTALTSIYRSQDFDLLLKSPVRLEILLLYKWCDIAVRGGATLFVLTMPPLISLGLTLHLGWGRIAALSLAVLSLSAMAVSLGVIMAMALMFVFPAKRMHQTLSILGLCFAALLITGFRFLHIETLWTEAAHTNPLFAFLMKEPAGWLQYAPGQLFALTMLPLLSDTPSNMGWLRLCMGLGVVSVAASMFVGARLFPRGWTKNREQADPQTRNGDKAIFLLGRTMLEGRLFAMMRKDWLLLRRDPAIWTQLFMMIPLAALYILNLSLLPAQLDDFKRMFAVVNVGLVAMLTAVIGARFLFPSASREGRAIWVQSSSSLPPFFIIGQKAMFALPPVVGVGGIMLIGSCWILKLPAELTWWSYAFGFFFIIQISVLALVLGYCFPMYRFRNLMEASLGKGAFLFMALAVVEIGGWTYYALRIIFALPIEGIPILEPHLLAWVSGWTLLTVLFSVWSLRRIRWLER